MSITQNLVYKADLSTGTPIVNLSQPLVVGDQDAHAFVVDLTDKGYKPNLENTTCRAYFVRKKKGVYEAETIILPGTVNDDNVAVTLNASCYSRSAYFSLFVKLSDNATGEIRTILIVRGTVIASQDGNVLDPEDVVMTLDELLAQIAAMEKATAEAREATAVANQAAENVEEFKGEIQGDITTLTQEIAEETSRAKAEEARIEKLFTADVSESVNNWLDEHPEATTTVQDHSLTFDKMVVGTLGYVTPQMFGAKGDGVSDDTEAFIQLNGKTAFIPEGTYLISSVEYGSNTVLNGSGMGKTVLLQTKNNDSDFISFVDAKNSGMKNLTLKGRKGEENENEHTYQFQAMLKIRNTSAALHTSDYCSYEHISIVNACVNGLVLNGTNSNADGFDAIHKNNSWNWVHHFNDFRIEECGRFCMIDQSCDNRFSNFYLNEGDVGGAYINASSNMYVNFKIDQPYGGGSKGTLESFKTGALLIVEGSNALRFVNFDLQSGFYCGAKISYSSNIRYDGAINTCGIGNHDGYGLRFLQCSNCDFNVEFHDIYGYQHHNVTIDQYCSNINCFVKENNAATNINESPNSCFIADVCKLSSLFNVGNITMIKDDAMIFAESADFIQHALKYEVANKVDGFFVFVGQKGCIVGFNDLTNNVGYAEQLSYYGRYKYVLNGDTPTPVE